MEIRNVVDRLVAVPSPVTLVFVVAGLWLVLAPHLLGFGWHEAALGHSTVIGGAVVVMAVLRHVSRERFEKLRWTLLVLGAWMIASPFVTTFFHIEAARWSAVIGGAAILVGAIVATAAPAGHEPSEA